MISKYHLFLIAIVAGIAGCTRPSNNPGSVKKLKDLLDKNEYFKLDAKFKLLADSLDDSNRLYFKSYLDNVFNRNEECIKDVDSLLKQTSSQFPDSIKSNLKQLQGDSFFKTYQYAKAAQCDSNILKLYKHALRKDVIDDINNDLLIRNALKNIPAQQTIIKSNTTIPWKKDKIGLIEIPFKTNSQTFEGIFDTRANISSITQTYAKS
ncbi:hypothetical protein KXD93_29635 [Mucilaginibacter sp. BJC16-A38]|uniref:hypothetical protein n=1 Tax=Mucilaginibacter phenanthrenivorans TaxID=1234842 RepID=UPI00215863F2|nr:hypothetical protein [Mucilaginibacter phenanthrenivorans]MCR8561854.1 hypothetical protein [Mucilaginibacter phenanthrenivorans]